MPNSAEYVRGAASSDCAVCPALFRLRLDAADSTATMGPQALPILSYRWEVTGEGAPPGAAGPLSALEVDLPEGRYRVTPGSRGGPAVGHGPGPGGARGPGGGSAGGGPRGLVCRRGGQPGVAAGGGDSAGRLGRRPRRPRGGGGPRRGASLDRRLAGAGRPGAGTGRPGDIGDLRLGGGDHGFDRGRRPGGAARGGRHRAIGAGGGGGGGAAHRPAAAVGRRQRHRLRSHRARPGGRRSPGRSGVLRHGPGEHLGGSPGWRLEPGLRSAALAAVGPGVPRHQDLGRAHAPRAGRAARRARPPGRRRRGDPPSGGGVPDGVPGSRPGSGSGDAQCREIVGDVTPPFGFHEISRSEQDAGAGAGGAAAEPGSGRSRGAARLDLRRGSCRRLRRGARLLRRHPSLRRAGLPEKAWRRTSMPGTAIRRARKPRTCRPQPGSPGTAPPASPWHCRARARPGTPWERCTPTNSDSWRWPAPCWRCYRTSPFVLGE